MFFNIKNSLKEQFTNFNSFQLVEYLRKTVNNLESSFAKTLDFGVKIGIIIHLGYVIENAKNGGKRHSYQDLDKFIKQYQKYFSLITEEVTKLENRYDIKITEDEKAYLTEMFLYN
jgi:transcriptional regulatory protein LevR